MIFLERFQRCLFILISWKYAESQWDSISVGKESHLHDRVWTVFFTFSVFFISIFLFNLKVVVGTVVVKNSIVTF